MTPPADLTSDPTPPRRRPRLARLLVVALVAVLPTLALPLRATVVVGPEFGQLVNGSDYIIHAVVRDVVPEKQAGPSGTRIVTRVSFEIVEVVAGTPPGGVVILEFLGGRLGREQLRVDGMPRFAVGDEDILFVSGAARALCPLYGMMHGRYPVRVDPASGRKYVVRSDGVPLRSTAEISPRASAAAVRPQAWAPTPLSPAEFIEQIRAGVQPDSHAARTK